MSDRPARATDWDIQAAPALAALEFEQTLEPEPARRLLLGMVPREMEDKWFVFREGDELFFHRSWTGILLFRVALELLDDGRLRLHAARYNANPEDYSGNAVSVRADLDNAIRLVISH